MATTLYSGFQLEVLNNLRNSLFLGTVRDLKAPKHFVSYLRVNIIQEAF